ncbi:uncharacterized protein PHALS_07005 [Plasmopara halstedii]|uniref:Uncharacterized protein n=1 Tax=Plasmopara halstedii TaxID=4781 RepID=A0A0P1B3D4_PLAHL|nr:uncharacterized protein PHALS_07005 [Plasmopara halstedii]CEG49233.1 hypothetical protein PHALS_07005 [Plasmopara halstedii]|eukprot:XP_024585602.1 hypothetical protein PHALS_07005 [Plasmopara halstedii]
MREPDECSQELSLRDESVLLTDTIRRTPVFLSIFALPTSIRWEVLSIPSTASILPE